ncbi:MAG: hypothetical protein M1833_003678 [Piccolia ochrophora]|nr:MAG: hypothetical protein M1833_003678 [Piccolia ochrophora]
MARGAKKLEEKAKDAATLQVNVEDFVRTRDSPFKFVLTRSEGSGDRRYAQSCVLMIPPSRPGMRQPTSSERVSRHHCPDYAEIFRSSSLQVVTSLATLQSAVQDLSRAYIVHTNSVLGRAPGTSLDILSIANPLGENGILAPHPISPAAKSDTGDPKENKKKKRAHDPNAPKRPLTPYFLYMQSARPVIASDLGENAKPGDVSNEGTRRWTAMSDADKSLWKEAYMKNLAEYKTRVETYKAGLSGADAAAAQLAAENGLVTEGNGDVDLVEPVAEPEVSKEPSPPPEKPKKSRRKSTKDATETSAAAEKAAAVKETRIAPPPAKETVITPPSAAGKDKSPDKKRKRGDRKSTAGEDSEKAKEEVDKAKGSKAATTPKESASKEKRSKRSKRKSEVGDDA